MSDPTPGSPALAADFFARRVGVVARDLIGCLLLVDGAGGRIVEVERYQADDPASHSFRGRTPRNAPMFGPPAHLYVYRSYGVHWCLNVVCEEEGSAAAVLIRALEPTHGLPAMRARSTRADALLCAGPGRLCQALGVDGSLSGEPLGARVAICAREHRPRIVRGPRIGISVAVERPWRYGLAGSPSLSRPFPETGSA